MCVCVCVCVCVCLRCEILGQGAVGEVREAEDLTGILDAWDGGEVFFLCECRSSAC